MADYVYYPIIIPTLNRYDHLKRCVDSLSRNTGADKTELVIGLDYPPSGKYMEGYRKIKAYLPTITGFKKVTIKETEENLGEGRNVRRLREYIESEGYDGCIFSEDDCEFSPCFLEYQNWGLNTFKDDQSIYAICSLTAADSSFLRNNVYKVNNFYNSWGYGTWNNRIHKFEEYRKSYDKSNLLKNFGWSTIFNDDLREANSLITMFALRAFWSDLMMMIIPAEERWCIFPKINMVRNFGCDDSGIHGGNASLYKMFTTITIDDKKEFTPSINSDNMYSPRMDKRIREFYAFSGNNRVKAIVKFILFKLSGYTLIPNSKSKCKVKLQKVL